VALYTNWIIIINKEKIMEGVSKGNAGTLFTEENNGWFVGFFVDNDPYRQTNNVELKWKKHQPIVEGTPEDKTFEAIDEDKPFETIDADKPFEVIDENKPFEANHSAKSMTFLIQGSYRFEFKRGDQLEEVLLEEVGDYVIWLPKVEHRGYATAKDTIMLTLRWPSLHGDHFTVT
jgi:predicted  nucleic acid-binding Zn-ribbon protein